MDTLSPLKRRKRDKSAGNPRAESRIESAPEQQGVLPAGGDESSALYDRIVKVASGSSDVLITQHTECTSFTLLEFFFPPFSSPSPPTCSRVPADRVPLTTNQPLYYESVPAAHCHLLHFLCSLLSSTTTTSSKRRTRSSVSSLRS